MKLDSGFAFMIALVVWVGRYTLILVRHLLPPDLANLLQHINPIWLGVLAAFVWWQLARLALAVLRGIVRLVINLVTDLVGIAVALLLLPWKLLAAMVKGVTGPQSVARQGSPDCAPPSGRWTGSSYGRHLPPTVVEHRAVTPDPWPLGGLEFEQYLADYFRTLGYGVESTPGSGDQGVDLLLTKGTGRIAIQAKRHREPVGNAAVQAVYSGSHFYGANEAWVVATSSFTPKAVELAERLRVRLVDGQELRRWLWVLRSVGLG